MKLVTAAELEARGLLKRSTAYFLAHQDAIPHIRFGRRAIRFDPDEVEAFLKGQMRRPAQQAS